MKFWDRTLVGKGLQNLANLFYLVAVEFLEHDLSHLKNDIARWKIYHQVAMTFLDVALVSDVLIGALWRSTSLYSVSLAIYVA